MPTYTGQGIVPLDIDLEKGKKPSSQCSALCSLSLGTALRIAQALLVLSFVLLSVHSKLSSFEFGLFSS